jgi:PAS domain S-box-containing protein
MPGSKTILVIEDDQNIRESIIDLLETSNFNVISAPNGKEGLALAIEKVPDLILCDVMMPLMDGYEVIQAVRNEKTLKDVPFIFLSAKSQKTDMRKGMDLGADDYLTKPFRAQELFDAVETRIWKNEVGQQELRDTKVELEKLNQQMVAISEADIPVSMIISDLHGTIVHFSRGAERLLGYSATELVGKKPVTILHVKEEITERIIQLTELLGKEVNMSNSFITEIPSRYNYESREWTYVRKDKSTFPVQLVVSTILDGHGNITGYLGVGIDITEQKAAETALKYARDQAEKANRLKSQFLANMSHEIRTPMNSILGFSDILSKTIQEPEAKKHINAIVSSGRTLMVLINDLLDLAKIEAGKMVLKPEPVSLQLILGEIQQMFSGEAKKKNLELIVEVPEDLPATLVLDDIRLRQMLINLVGNGLKFTSAGQVKISVAFYALDTSSVNLQISVQDSGIGIDKADQPMVFESFEQVHDTTTSQYGGTGLGLTITKRLAELMKGKIDLESEKGMGSTFTIHLPEVQCFHAEAQEINTSFGKDLFLKFEPATILAVDDVQSNLDLLITLFGNQPITFFTALDGREAVIKAETLKPDLILMDIRMPELDGIEASKRIKSVDKFVPIIACTASLLGGEKDLDIFNAILFKPLQRSKLMETVGRFLPHREIDTSAQASDRNIVPTGEFDMEHIRSLKDKFEARFSDRIKRLLEVIDVNEMEILVIDLKEFTGAHQLESVYPLVNALTSHVEHFELDLITEDLKNLLNLFGLKVD